MPVMMAERVSCWEQLCEVVLKCFALDVTEYGLATKIMLFLFYEYMLHVFLGVK